ncbi:MAG: hypothetical protein ABI091_23385 [Ferruginibacter sp.]
MTKGEILSKFSHNYKKYSDREYGTSYDVYVRGSECEAAMEAYAKQEKEQESAAFARWLDTYNHPIGERQSFETLYDIYKNKP